MSATLKIDADPLGGPLVNHDRTKWLTLEERQAMKEMVKSREYRHFSTGTSVKGR